MPPLRIWIVALLTVVLVAGCGGSDDSAKFKRDFKGVNDELIDLGTTVGQALQKAPQTSDLMLAGEFSGYATQLQALKGRVDALKPPGDLRAKVTALSTALGKLVADLRRIGHAATVHDTTAAREGTQALIADSTAAGNARRALARKTGARVGP